MLKSWKQHLWKVGFTTIQKHSSYYIFSELIPNEETQKKKAGDCWPGLIPCVPKWEIRRGLHCFLVSGFRYAWTPTLTIALCMYLFDEVFTELKVINFLLFMLFIRYLQNHTHFQHVKKKNQYPLVLKIYQKIY